jgi:hypothetical protein
MAKRVIEAATSSDHMRRMVSDRRVGMVNFNASNV